MLAEGEPTCLGHWAVRRAFSCPQAAGIDELKRRGEANGVPLEKITQKEAEELEVSQRAGGSSSTAPHPRRNLDPAPLPRGVGAV